VVHTSTALAGDSAFPTEPSLETGHFPSSGRIPELDGLRGLAILLVLVCHFIGNSDHTSLPVWLDRLCWVFRSGWTGVDLFFVLSGFLIGGILLDSRNSDHYFQRFYIRRVHRILPVYFLLMMVFAVTVGTLQFFPEARAAVSLRELLVLPKCVFFLQNLLGSFTDFQWRWFVVTWSLAVEEQFYLVSPLFIRYLSVPRLTGLLACFVIASPILRFVGFRYFHGGLLNGALTWRADTLAFGMLAAIAWRTPAFREALTRNQRGLRWVVVLLAAGVLLLLKWLIVLPLPLVTVSVGYSWIAALFTGLLLLVISQTHGRTAGVMRMSWLRSLGTISYCLYLVHMPINQFSHLLLLHRSRPSIEDWKGVAVTLLAAALSLLVARLSWIYVESPLIRRGHCFPFQRQREVSVEAVAQTAA
jgi:peptidoglycan/LPS O-acetylase OafA/YrhL